VPHLSPDPHCVHTSRRICANLRIEFRVGWGGELPPTAPFVPCAPVATLMHHVQGAALAWYPILPRDGGTSICTS